MRIVSCALLRLFATLIRQRPYGTCREVEMIDLSVYDRYLANEDDLSPELTQELRDAYRALQGEIVRLKAHLAEQEAGRGKPIIDTNQVNLSR